VQTADRYQTGIRLDHSPSVVWSDYDAKFHLATQRRIGTVSSIVTYTKNHSTGASWGSSQFLLDSTNSISAGFMGTINAYGWWINLRLFFLQYEE
jgi:hypothetical protein